MDMYDQKIFLISHPMDLKLKYLLSIIEEKDLGLSGNEFKLLKLSSPNPSDSQEELVSKLNLLKEIFYNQSSKELNNQQFTNFMTTIALKLCLTIIKKKKKDIPPQIKQLGSSLIRDFKKCQKKNQILKAINSSKDQFIQKSDINDSLSEKFSNFNLSGPESIYTFLLGVYYYFLKEKVIQSFEFQPLKVQNQLIKIKHIYQPFYLDYSKELRYFTKKQPQFNIIIDQETTNQIIDILKQQRINLKVRVCLSQTIKNLANNGGINHLSVSNLIEVVKNPNINRDIKVSICQALISCQKSSSQTQANLAKKAIDQIIQDNQDAELNQLFIERRIMLDLGVSFKKELTFFQKQNVSSFKSIQNYSYKKAIKIKNISVSSSSQQQQQEEFQQKIELKNSQQQQKFQKNKSNLKKKEQDDGSDQDFWSGTFINIKNLYNKAISNKYLKKIDKDAYLKEKFMNKSQKIYEKGTLGQYFIDRMIGKIYEIISQKQELRIQTLQNLLKKCIKNQGDFQRSFLESLQINQSGLIKAFKENKKYYSTLYQFKQEDINIILKAIDTQDMNLIKREIDEIRVSAISTIYYILYYGDQQINKVAPLIKPYLLNQLKNYRLLEPPLNSRYFTFFLLIFDLVYSQLIKQKEINHDNLMFNACIIQLKNKRCKQQSLKYLRREASKIDKHSNIFINQQIQKVAFEMAIEKERQSYKLMMDILTFYTMNSLLPRIKFRSLKMIAINANSKFFKKQYYTVLYLNTRKKREIENSQIIENQVIQDLIYQFQKYTKKSSEQQQNKDKNQQSIQLIIMLVLLNLSERLPIKQLDLLSSMLLNDTSITFEGEQIIFKKQVIKKQSLTISQVTAKIFKNTLNKFKMEIKLNNIFLSLKHSNYKTKVQLSDILENYSKNMKISFSYLVDMEQLFDELPQLHLKLSLMKVYLNTAKSNIGQFYPNQLHKILLQDEIYINDKETSKQLNLQILSLLTLYTNQHNFRQFREGKTFDVIIFFLNSNQYKEVEDSFLILRKYSEQFVVPKHVLQTLDRVYKKSCFSQQNTQQLSIYLETIYENLIKNDEEVAIDEINLWTEKMLKSQKLDKGKDIYNKLNKISKNQDLPKPIFDTIEVERCCSRYDQKKQIQQKIVEMTSQGTPLNSSINLTKMTKKINPQSINVIKILYNISTFQRIRIPMDVIKNLLVIFNPNSQDCSRQKLIAQIIVKNYQNFQTQQIFEEFRFFESVENTQLLQITLPLMIKKNLQQDSQENKNILNKLILFYDSTEDIRHKESISSLFLNQRVVQSIYSFLFQDFIQILIPKGNYTRQLKKNCQQGLRILSNNGSEKAQQYIRQSQKDRQAEKQRQNNFKKMQEQKRDSFQVKNFIECVQQKQKQKQQQKYPKIIFQKIVKILESLSDKSQIQKLKKITDERIRRDYLYQKNALVFLLNQLQITFLDQKKDQSRKKLLQIIVLISSIHQSHVFEPLLINSIHFISQIENCLLEGSIYNQMLQIYIKVIEQQQCQKIEEVLNKLIICLKKNYQKDFLFNILLVFQKSMINYRQQIKKLMTQPQNKNIILNIVENSMDSSYAKFKFISVKIQKYNRDIFSQTSKNLQILSTFVNSRYENLLSTKVIDDFLEVLALCKVNQTEIIFQRQDFQQNICNLLLKNCIFKVSMNDADRIRFKLLWDQNFYKIEMTILRIQLLVQIFLHCEEIVEYGHIHQFLEYLIFNDSLKSQRVKLINNIKNHKFKQQKIIKMLIQLYIQKLEKKLIFEPQKILHIAYFQNIQTISMFFSELLELESKQIVKAINTIYDQQYPLFTIMQKKSKLTLNHIHSINILKKIEKILQRQLTKKQKQRLDQLTIRNLAYLNIQQLSQLLNGVGKMFNNIKVEYLVQLLDLTSCFQTQSKQYMKLFKECTKPQTKQQIFLQKLNQLYFSSIANKKKVRNSQQCIQNLKFYPQTIKQSYLKNKKTQLLQPLKQIQQTSSYKSEFSKLNTNKQSLKEWKDDGFEKWAKQIKKDKKYTESPSFIKEALIIIKEAISRSTNKATFRNNQVLSCLLLLGQRQNKQIRKGKLLQISTGEGKSVIICAAAIILALKGHKVDIVTTSSILAERDAQQYQKIYKLFGLSVADNIDREQYVKGKKKCYTKNIVYGELSQFCFDYLRHVYYQLNTLGGRKKTFVIVDEVDSMLIDDCSKITKISSNIIGIQKLQIVYGAIWQKLLSIKRNILEFNDQEYYFDGRIEQRQGKLAFYYKSQNSQQEKQIIDLQSYLLNIKNRGEKPIQSIKLLQQNSRETIKKQLISLKDQFVKRTHIPKNFKQLVDVQLPKWIQSALIALQYQQDIDYIIQNQKINPVDYDNTGKVQHLTNWGNGLHQFLQLKHFLRMTPENLTTNFISNFKYFQLYDQILGMTGTFGSQACQQTLHSAYQVDLIIIPDSLEKKNVQYPTQVGQNSQQWMSKIFQRTKYQLNKKRGVLIICQTIQHCNYLHSYFAANQSGCKKIKIYNMNNKGQQASVKNIQSLQIIIATNLAGRGTDIKTEKIQNYGGLHVIITFLPKNLRVQRQIKGRTGRNGNHGSSQLIINKRLLSKDYLNNNNLLLTRNKKQQQMLAKFLKQKQTIIQKDNVFHQFCSFFKQIKIELRKQYSKQIWQNIELSIEQRWALFFNNNSQRSEINWKDGLCQFKKSFSDIKNAVKLIENPYYSIKSGYYFINRDIPNSIDYFFKSIDLDEGIISSWLGLGELYLQNPKDLKIKEQFQKKILKKKSNNKSIVLYCFQKALKIVKQQLQAFFQLQQYSLQSKEKSLFNQISAKKMFLYLYQLNIDQNIKKIKQSRKQVTIVSQRQSSFSNEMIFNQTQRNFEQIKKTSEKEYKLKQLHFHHLNSHLSSQTSILFDKIQSISKQKKSNILFKIQLIKISFAQLNKLLLNNIRQSNLDHQALFKKIKGYSSNKSINLNIYEEIGENKRMITGNSLKCLHQFQRLAFDEKKSYIFQTQDVQVFFQGFLANCEVDIKCKDITIQKCSQIINLIYSQSYEIQTSISGSKYQQLCSLILNNNYPAFIQENNFNGAKLQRRQTKLTRQNFMQYNQKNISLRFLVKGNKQFYQLSSKILENLFITINFKKCTYYKPVYIKDINVDILFHSFKKNPSQNIKFAKSIIDNSKNIYNLDVIIQNLSQYQQQKFLNLQIQEYDVIVQNRQQIQQLMKKSYNQIQSFILEGMKYQLIIKLKNYLPIKALIANGLLALSLGAGGIFLFATGNLWIAFNLLEMSIVNIASFFFILKNRQFNFKQIDLLFLIGGFGSGGAAAFFVRKSLQLNESKNRQYLRIKHIQRKLQVIKANSQFKKNIYHQIYDYTKNLLKNNPDLQQIIYKMFLLDFQGTSRQWQRKLLRSVKGIINACQQDQSVKLLAQKIAKNMKYQEDNFSQILQHNIKRSLEKIIEVQFKKIQINVYQIQSSMLKLNSILIKYSNINQTEAKKIYQIMLSSNNFITTKKVAGTKQEFKIQNLNAFTLDKILQMNNKEKFLINCKKNINNKVENTIDLPKMISEELSNIISELTFQQENSLQNPSEFSIDINKKLMQQAVSLVLNQDQEQVQTTMLKNHKIQQQILGKQEQDAKSLKQYCNLILTKQATPVDITMLLEQYNLKIQLVKIEPNDKTCVKNCIRYYQLGNKYFYNPQQKKNKYTADQGFFQVAQLLKIETFKLRQDYMKIFQKRKSKFIKYLKNYGYLYRKIQTQELKSLKLNQFSKKRYVGFKHILKNYQECSIITQIKKIQNCIKQHVLIEKNEKNVETAFIMISTNQGSKNHLIDFIKVIQKFNVEAFHINNKGQQSKILKGSYQEQYCQGKILVKLLLNRRSEQK